MPECACGCGGSTAGGTFLPGHDSKLRADAEHRAGGVVRLAKLVDAAEAFRAGTIPLDVFGQRVAALMPQNDTTTGG
jgi:hypothetical protein